MKATQLPMHKSLVAACSIAVLTGIPSALTRANSLQIEEVIVTAQKREESLQDTPVAISAFTAKAMKNKGIENISEVADFTPNLIFDTTSPISGLSSGAAVFIRGIGNTDFSLTTDPGVGTYVDGVYMSRSVGGVLDVLDVERIEVLRGPQGTLFGRNTIGGAINITSRKPADEFQGNLELTIGNFDRKDLRASIDIPVSDTLRTALALSSKTSDGFVERVLVGDKMGDEERISVRGTAVFEPNNSWDFQLSVDHSKINEESAPSGAAGFTTAFPDGTPGGAGVIGYGLATFGDIATGLAELTQYITDAEDEKTFATGISGTKLEINGTSLINTYHGDSYDLKYSIAYRKTAGEFFSDPDNTPHSITEVYNPDYDHEQISHELQITGTAIDDRLKYAGGMYYFEEEGTDNVFVPLFLPTPDLSAGFAAGLKNFADVDNTSEAAYLQLTWDITDVLSITGGVRHTRDEKSYDYTQYIAADIEGNPLPFFPGAVNEHGVFTPGLLPLVGNGSGTINDVFEETTYKLAMDAKLSDGTLLYYSYAQGFKSGGFVLRYVESVPTPRSFDPETVDTHEIGVKWQGLNDRVRLNTAVFYSDYDEVQVTFYDSLGGPVTANAGTVEIKGVELELTALLADNLQLDMGYGYTNAEYTQINPIAGLSSSIDENAKLVNTPENTLNIGLEYNIPLAANQLSLRVDYSYVDDIQNDSQNSPFLFQEAYALWNASARFTIGDTVEVVAFVKNLTDERHIVSGNSNYGLGFHSAVYNKPQQYGATFRYSF